MVITHHLPSAGSVLTKYVDSELNAAFVSRIDETVVRSDLWLHGHSHESCDYVVDGTNGRTARVVCNPRGYSRHQCDVENVSFDPALKMSGPSGFPRPTLQLRTDVSAYALRE